ncbi:prepilin peptidase [Sphingomonas sp. 37zxx]|uniref:prepilin peptidase n=1 Tax=Sphingomonas sp. 37zxx TaxID=1550073 RepID=UPI00053BDC68|nr:A24 family peptidase [Sphingomonas sp. 37zxx]
MIWPVLLGTLGAVFGSFIATVAIRWPQGRSALHGRSACDGCGKPLRVIELVPILSFAVQRGRCRACGTRIAIGHPVTEVAGLVIGVSAGLVAPGIEGAVGALFGWLLLALAAIDLAAFWLPNPLVLALAIGGLAGGAARLPPPLFDRAIGGMAGFGVLWLVAFVYRRARGRMGLGGGDPKLFGAIGLWLGWQALPQILLAACILGILAALLLRRTRASDRLPLGTLLAIAAYGWWLVAVGGSLTLV